MIHFFRKIRQKLLGENNFSKYLFYAIGEVFLVMIGIMLALYFDNLNTESENEKKERWYLINIVEDIEYQKADLEDLQEKYKKNILIGKNILRDYNKYQSFTKIDSLNIKLNALMSADNFPNINNTYQELVSSGQQTLIQNKNLSIDIIDYYLFCEDNYIDFENNNNNIFYKVVFPIFYNSSQISLVDLNEGEQDLLINDTIIHNFINDELNKPSVIYKLVNAIKIKIIILSNHLEMVNETLSDSKELVKKIDTYLEIKPEDINTIYK